jgi:hypothetical protein
MEAIEPALGPKPNRCRAKAAWVLGSGAKVSLVWIGPPPHDSPPQLFQNFDLAANCL